MYKIIEKLLLGNRGQLELISSTDEYKRLRKEDYAVYNKLYPTLSDEQKALFDEEEEIQSQLEYETALAFYSEGLRIGILLGIECGKES